jgi:hypothetical protein
MLKDRRGNIVEVVHAFSCRLIWFQSPPPHCTVRNRDVSVDVPIFGLLREYFNFCDALSHNKHLRAIML